MSEDAQAGLIGPNAVLQLLPVLEQAGGVALREALMAVAGMQVPPSDAGLMPEEPAAQAGRGTADYILAHRIPQAAQVVLRLLPGMLTAPLLSRAIARHAWTFAGSGRFAVAGPLVFEIAANPIVAGEHSAVPICHWHAAVFERLFRVLVDDRLRCVETACCACGDPACRFALSRV